MKERERDTRSDPIPCEVLSRPVNLLPSDAVSLARSALQALKAAHKTEAAKMKKLSKTQKAGEKDKARPTLSRRQNRGQRVR